MLHREAPQIEAQVFPEGVNSSSAYAKRMPIKRITCTRPLFRPRKATICLGVALAFTLTIHQPEHLAEAGGIEDRIYEGLLVDIHSEACAIRVFLNNGDDREFRLAGIICRDIPDSFKTEAFYDRVSVHRIVGQNGEDVFSVHQPDYDITLQSRLVVLGYAEWISEEWKSVLNPVNRATDQGSKVSRQELESTSREVNAIVTGVDYANRLELDSGAIVGLLGAPCEGNFDVCLLNEYRRYLQENVVGRPVRYTSSADGHVVLEWAEIFLDDESLNLTILRRGLATIKSEAGVPPHLIEAGEHAKAQHQGFWAPELYVPGGTNIRSCPGTNCPIIRVAKQWETLRLSSEDGDWRSFSESDTELWVHKSVSAIGKEEREALIGRRLMQAVAEGAELIMTSWTWHSESGFAITSGEVFNVTDHPLRQVVAVVSFYTESGEFITSGDALVDFDPIMPGQLSPFKVYVRWNPLMSKATLRFKTFGGRQISSRPL